MKNQGKEDEYIRQFISEQGTEDPPEGFHKSILSRLNNAPSASVYTPVISSLGWKIIGGAIASLFITVLIFVPNGSDATPLLDQLPSISFPEVVISLPKITFSVINLSPIVLQSLAAFIILAFLTVITSLNRWKTF